MTLSGTEVLLFGQNMRNEQALTDRLRQWGFRCHFVNDVRAAWHLLNARLSI